MDKIEFMVTIGMNMMSLQGHIFLHTLYYLIREGFKKKKKVIFITLGSDPPPLKSDKNIFYFLDTRPFFEHFLKKMYFCP